MVLLPRLKMGRCAILRRHRFFAQGTPLSSPPGQSISIAYNPAIFTGAVTDNAGVACDDCFVSSMLTQLRLRQEWPQITDGKTYGEETKEPRAKTRFGREEIGCLVADLPDRLLSDIRSLIEQARQQVARTVNSPWSPILADRKTHPRGRPA